jgi:hypothetical protein
MTDGLTERLDECLAVRDLLADDLKVRVAALEDGDSEETDALYALSDHITRIDHGIVKIARMQRFEQRVAAVKADRPELPPKEVEPEPESAPRGRPKAEWIVWRGGLRR